MAGYESRIVRGWRGRLDDEAAEIRNRIWEAPALTVYIEGREAPSPDKPYGYSRWFNREFGHERAAASSELQQLKRLKCKIALAEMTEQEREERREKIRIWFRQWRAKRSQSAEWRREQAEKKRLRRMAKPELYHAIDRRSLEKTRDARNERRRQADKENPEKFKAMRKASRAARRERSNHGPAQSE